MKDKSEINILLVQNRKDAMKEHEQKCILRAGGFNSDQLRILNIFEEEPSVEHLEGIDLIVVGGSGNHCVSEGGLPVLENVYSMLRAAREKKIPIIGICYGAHILTMAFGGKLVLDKSREEIGTILVTLTENGKQDPIFKKLPDEFYVQTGHKDHINELPPGAVNLATTKTSPNQAWTFPGEPIYALQFHAEVTEEDAKNRIEYYNEQYIDCQEELKDVLDGLKPSPEANKIFGLFLGFVFGGAE